jgi:ferredoxin-type protein NapH
MSFSFPRNPVKYPFHTFRGLVVQPFFWALLLLSPVLQIFQLDVINQQMVAWGHRFPFEPSTLMWVPIGFFACVLIIAVASTMFGRLFCGWVCPHNTLVEWTRPVRTLIGIGKKSYRLKQLEARWPWMKGVGIAYSLLWATAITFTISVLFLFYFVPVEWFFNNLQDDTMPFIVWWGIGLMMLIGYFMLYAGHEFCRSACPYGISQSLSAYLTSKWIPMEIRHKHGEDLSACKSCHACQSACPVDIDPREPENLVMGVGEGCFNCGECIDACTYVRSFQKKDNLLYFKLPFGGTPGDDKAINPRELAH